MPATEGWVPRGVDTRTPSTARIYDYLLGGKDNYECDRVAAAELIEKLPDAQDQVQQNRAFLRAAVRYLAGEAGVRQFIDVGTGIPAQGAVHEVAHEVDPAARVVYVDNDPMVLVHARALMQHASDGVGVVDADMRQPDAVLDRVDETGLIDFDEPVAVLFIAMLHFVTDDESPGSILDAVRTRMAPGSHLVISHVTDERDPTTVGSALQTYNRATSSVTTRRTSEVRDLFSGFDLVTPGVVSISQWRAEGTVDTPDPNVLCLGGVGKLTARRS